MPTIDPQDNEKQMRAFANGLIRDLSGATADKVTIVSREDFNQKLLKVLRSSMKRNEQQCRHRANVLLYLGILWLSGGSLTLQYFEELRTFTTLLTFIGMTVVFLAGSLVFFIIAYRWKKISKNLDSVKTP